jgi:hypothetical protein
MMVSQKLFQLSKTFEEPALEVNYYSTEKTKFSNKKIDIFWIIWRSL